MVDAKLVRVRDRGTDMVFMVAKFEEKDRELLEKTGWSISDKLSIIATLGDKLAGSISTFNHPTYDIVERSDTLSYNGTTEGVAVFVRDTKFEDIPDVIDLRRNHDN